MNLFEGIQDLADELAESIEEHEQKKVPFQAQINELRSTMAVLDKAIDAAKKSYLSRLEAWQPDSFGRFLHAEKAGVWELTDAEAYISNNWSSKDEPRVRLTFRRVKSDGSIDTAKTPITIHADPLTAGAKFPFTPYEE